MTKIQSFHFYCRKLYRVIRIKYFWTWKTHNIFTISLLIRLRFPGFCYESGISLFAWRICRNYAYNKFDSWILNLHLIDIILLLNFIHRNRISKSDPERLKLIRNWILNRIRNWILNWIRNWILNWIRNWILNWIWIKNVPGYPIRWEYVWVYLVGWRVEWAGSRSGSRMVERMGPYWGWVDGDPMRFEFNQWQKNLEIPLVFLHSIGLYISSKNLRIFPISVR